MPDNLFDAKFLLRALRHRNYRLFFIGQSVSLVGSWMQMIAMSWLVYRLTHSAFLLGIIGFLSQAPTLFISPFAGALADRWNRKSILVITQILAMGQAFILAALVYTHTIQVWHIVALSALSGFGAAFDAPARQAFIVDIVDNRADLGNAIALNSLLFNGARLVGAPIAGIVIALKGEGACFLLNGLSFFTIIVALYAMRVKIAAPHRQSAIIRDLKEGWRYVVGYPLIRNILFLIALVSLIGMSYMVLMPILAKDILGGGAHTLGFLMGASGFGAVSGALYLASEKNADRLIAQIPSATLVFGIALASLSFSRNLTLSLLLMVLVGFGMITQMVSSNMVLQHITDDDKRGRVMSFYTIAFMGMVPFGSLFGGSIASKIGVPHTLLLSGLACIAGSFLYGGSFRKPL